jgi:ABC-type polar amino acid transport system ATPase subunit
VPDVEVHGLWAGYGAGDVLQDFDLAVDRGESVRLVGCIAGSHKPNAWRASPWLLWPRTMPTAWSD